MPTAFMVVPFVSLAAVCLALVRIGRSDGHGLLWGLGALLLSVPPMVFVALLTLDLTRPFEQVFSAALFASIYLSAPLAAVMTWIAAVLR